MQSILLQGLLDSLSRRKSSNTVFNQYQDKNILNNLRLYLEYLIKNNSKILLIGEAPGYRGCRLTGIPLTSGKVIINFQRKIKIFKEIGNEIKLHQIVSENTATIFWNFLASYNKPVPILWNAFPFHPHKKEMPESNRKPNRSEIEEGKEYLKIIYDLFKPEKLCSLGCVGERVLNELFPYKNIIYIRHPSYGGKEKFINGILKLYDS
ncbi:MULTISPECIES: uracil-DNA glycosylase [Thermodesulfovibrio]|jgi:hypothetical protein|uniref:uracil-DNA glycosylase n=1 Tax=Thermodesulfovibrio TaxID=28261 RepID=UPI0026338F34|nr:uracil-DNA glycosylase [Thermodesulfovibrio sp.]